MELIVIKYLLALACDSPAAEAIRLHHGSSSKAVALASSPLLLFHSCNSGIFTKAPVPQLQL
jgi:hypothetical protein